MKALRIEQPQAVAEQHQAVDEQPKAAEVQPVSSEPNRRANQVVPEQEVVHKRGTKGTQSNNQILNSLIFDVFP